MKKLGLLLPCLLALTGCAPDPSSIGVIGGSDGPTAIFLAATSISTQSLMLFAIPVILLVALLVFLIKRK